MRKRKIKELVLDTFNVSERELVSKKRDRHIINARKAYSYFLHRNTDMTLTKIGREFGGKNHSTIIHYLKCTYNHLETDNDFMNKISSISENIKRHNQTKVERKEDFMRKVDWSGIISELNNRNYGL